MTPGWVVSLRIDSFSSSLQFRRPVRPLRHPGERPYEARLTALLPLTGPPFAPRNLRQPNHPQGRGPSAITVVPRIALRGSGQSIAAAPGARICAGGGAGLAICARRWDSRGGDQRRRGADRPKHASHGRQPSVCWSPVGRAMAAAHARAPLCRPPRQPASLRAESRSKH